MPTVESKCTKYTEESCRALHQAIKPQTEVSITTTTTTTKQGQKGNFEI